LLTANFIGQVERGTNAPSFDVLAKLAEVLEVKFEELFQFPEEK
jgi:transcriptional regulator with XRE-family HTH domain